MKLFLKILIITVAISLFGSRAYVNARQQANRRIDSILLLVANANDDTNKVKLLDDLSFGYYMINPNEGLKYGQEELSMSQKLGWKKGIALAYNSIGDNYLTKSDFAVSLGYYFKAVQINEELGNKTDLAKNFNHIGVVYKQLKNYTNALDYYFKALKINEAQSNKTAIALNLGNIGNIYCFQKDFEKALEYDRKSLAIYVAAGDSAEVSHIYGNIGLVYKNKGEYTKSLEYYFKALEIDEHLNQKNEIAIKSGNIGDCYLQMAESTGKKEYLAKAIYFLKKGITTSTELGNLIDIMTHYKNLSDAEAMAGKKNDAFESYKQYVTYKDSVFSIENSNRIAVIDYDRKRNADSLKAALKQNEQTYQINLLQKEYKLDNAYLLVTIIVLVMAVVIIGLIYNNYRKSRKNIDTLTVLNNQISDQKAELEKKNKEKDKILHMVAHDLRTPVGGVLFLANEMQSDNAADFSTDEVFSMIKEASESAMTLINELLGYSNDLHTESVKEPTNIVKLVNDTLKMLQFKANEKQQKLKNITLPSAPVFINVNKEQLMRVISNLAVNAMKFSTDGEVILVKVTQENQKILITIKDEGIGIPAKMQAEVFDMFTTAKRFGTAGEKSYGLGLSICKQIIDAHGGKIWFYSVEGQGTTFFVQLPQ